MLALSRADGSEIWRTNTGTAPYAPIATEGLVIADSGSPDEDHYTLVHEPDVFGVGDVVAPTHATGRTKGVALSALLLLCLLRLHPAHSFHHRLDARSVHRVVHAGDDCDFRVAAEFGG